ncbi:class I SAM-dependent methyltransferase [Fodinibius salsisoli]|uniref:Class I SAM-dependent methyltransferase n=1 Tax=Fodinibius salsisoli TaxID=2820877 RepID=A0ABT3PRG6_9BACT|nr:class I SAM-dependent methyltransferase [Fodinibius salsisoli]MCW9708455.1 class I SAM-dependent methyltransferase [Fodinibius salsisoli]
MSISSCILCNYPNVQLFYEDTSEHYASKYFQCRRCRLIFVLPKDRPSPKEEFERYETHENDPKDEGYRNFLSQLSNPLSELLEPQSKGLDFGSGPGPTLNIMFEEQGHQMNIYDPFYADHPEVFEETYDFITATEVVEHLHEPGKEFQQLWSCLRPGGYLGIMTKRAKDDEAFFADWHYRLDETHVTFYTQQTFRWIANHWEASIIYTADRVVIFQKEDTQ